MRRAAILVAISLAIALPAGAAGDTSHVAAARDPNPCLAPAARELLCPHLTISRPSRMYFDRLPGGRVLLRATSSINSVGRGPVELHGRRTGPSSMRATQ